LALCRARWPTVISHLAGTVAGLATVLWLISPLSFTGTGPSAISETAVRVWIWLRAAFSGGISADVLPFSFLLTWLIWLMAFGCTWFVIRHRSYWPAVVISGSALVINMSILLESNKMEFFLFLLPALLLRVRMQSLERSVTPVAQGKRSGTSWATLRDGALFTAAILIAGFMLPSGKDARSLDGFYSLLHSPVERFGGNLDRLFAGVYARVPGGVRVFGDQLALGGTVDLSDVPTLIVESQSPVYLRARAYDSYSSAGWTTSPTEVHALPSTMASPESSTERTTEQVIVTPLFSSELRFAAGRLEQIDLPSDVEVFMSPVYAANLRNSVQNAAWPESIKSAVRTIQNSARPSGTRQVQTPPTAQDLQKLLPPDIVLMDITYDRGSPAAARLMRQEPSPPDMVSVRVKNGSFLDKYSVTVSFSQAGPQDLRESGVAYPGWVTDRYTHLPATLPKRVRDLTDQITSDAATPYDKAIAIESYLRTNIAYSLVMDPPPYNGDGVDYFLFTAKKGYCDYFASAMAVMLRAEGVPARVVSGFAPGERAGDGKFLVRDRDSHSWPQVYFPGQGWIDFEPTPGRTDRYLESAAQIEDLLGDMIPMDADPFDEDAWLNDPSTLVGTSYRWGPSRNALWSSLLLGFSFLVLLSWVFWRRAVSVPATPEAGFGRLCVFGKLAGIPLRSAQTPYEYARSVGLRWPEAKEQVWNIADVYVRDSYGKNKPSLQTGRRSGEDWVAVRSAFLKRFLWRRRQQL